jgi:seryl-tRNA synthetase
VIDLKRLRQDPEGSRASLLRRSDPAVAALVDEVLALDRRRRELLVRVEALKAERNAASEEVARRKRAREPADELMATLKASGEQVRALDQELREIDAELDRRALTLPNFPAPEVPDGDASANRVVRSWGEPRKFDFMLVDFGLKKFQIAVPVFEVFVRIGDDHEGFRRVRFKLREDEGFRGDRRQPADGDNARAAPDLVAQALNFGCFFGSDAHF